MGKKIRLSRLKITKFNQAARYVYLVVLFVLLAALSLSHFS
jgi:hypothetical protein